MMFRTVFQVTFLALLVLHISRVGASDPLFITPTGRQIPLHLIRTRLPKAIRHEPVENHVFDVSSQRVLHGPNNLRLDLHTLSRVSNISDDRNALVVSVNGASPNTVSERNLRTVRKSSDDDLIHAIFGGTHNRLLAVWGQDFHLKPVHHTDYPDVFVNVHIANPTRMNLEDDIVFGNKNVHQSPNMDGAIEVNFTYDGPEDSKLDYHRKNTNNSKNNKKDTPTTASNTGRSCANNDIHYIELSIAFDNTLCAMFGNDVNSVISLLQAMVDFANTPYRAQTCVSLALTYIHGFCNSPNDPFSPTSIHPLFQFREVYNANFRNIPRDLAYLVTGYEDGEGAIGRAWLEETCDQQSTVNRAYGWLEYIDPYVLAHEIGHNLNCHHTATGLMLSFSDRSQFFFEPGSVANITDYLDNTPSFDDTTCITGDPPSCDSTCPGACQNGKCYVNEGPPAYGLISCIPAQGHFFCVGRENIPDSTSFFNVAIDCDTQYGFVSADYDVNDPTLVCCEPTTQAMSVRSVKALDTRRTNELLFRGVTYFNVLSPFNLIQDYTFLDTERVACNTEQNPTPSPSSSISMTVPTPTMTASSSSSATASPPSTVPSSPSLTASSSRSVPASPSSTSSASATVSTSISAIPTISMLISSSPSLTVSPVPSESASVSANAGTTASVSLSSSSTFIPSVSASMSSSSTADPLKTISASSSSSTSPSVSPSPSVSSSSSSVPSSQPILTITLSATPTLSTTSTITASTSPSLSALPSRSIMPSVSSSPMPSSSITQTAIGVSPSVSVSLSVTPTSTASPVGTPSGVASVSASVTLNFVQLTCADTFTLRRHLRCQTRRTGNQEIAPQRRINLIADIAFGRIRYTVRVPRRFFIRTVGVVFSKKPQISASEFSIERLGNRRGRISREYGTLIEDIPLLNAFDRCCGNAGLYVHITSRICVRNFGRRRNQFDNRCETGTIHVPLRIRCGRTCRSPSAGIPMGPSEECPRCS